MYIAVNVFILVVDIFISAADYFYFVVRKYKSAAVFLITALYLFINGVGYSKNGVAYL